MTDERFERIRFIVGEALELDGEEREHFIAESCGDDDALRAEVLSLLGAPDGGVLETKYVESLIHAEAADLFDETEADLLSSSVGEFRVVESLGRGGMGQVYLADQTAPVERRVALKVVRLGLDSPEVLTRFRMESQALARMSHPNIARIFGAGTTKRGRPFFVMEYVEGESLLSFCDSKRLTLRQRLELFRGICDGVEHAHRRGIIHRDLKPSNVLVSEVDGQPVPKIIDFGISKPQSRDGEFLTQFGQLLGTPEYMSPEQADPSGDVDTRTDVYSLGVLLYELLAGAPPFDGASLRKAGLVEIQRMLLEQEPPRPSTRLSTLREDAEEIARRRGAELPRLVRSLSGELDWIVLRALEKDRERRYESPHSFSEDIERYLDDRPVLASPPSRSYQAKKFVRRHRVGIGIAAAILFGLLGAGGGLTWALIQSQQKEIETAAARDEAEAVTSFLTEMLQEVDPEESGKDVTVREALDQAAATVEEKFADRPLLAARLRSTIGHTYLRLTLYEEARGHLEWALETRQRLLGEKSEPALWTMSRLGELHTQLSNYALAESLLTFAMEGRLEVLGEEHPRTTDSMNDLAHVYLELGEYDKAQPLLERFIDYWTEREGPESIGVLRARNTLANLFAYKGDAKRSESIYLEILEAQKRTLGALHPLTLSTLNNLAMTHYDLGQVAATESLLVRVLEGRREIYDQGHTELVEASTNLGAFYSVLGRFDEAIPVMEEGLEVATQLYGADQRNTLFIANNLGNAYLQINRLEDAERLLERAVDGRMRTMGDRHRDTLSSQANLAAVWLRQGRFDEGVALHRKVLALRTEELGATHAHTILSQLALGDALLGAGDLAGAAPLLESALVSGETELGEEHPRTNAARLSVAELRGRQGRWQECELLLHPRLAELSEDGSETDDDDLRVLRLAAQLYDATGRQKMAASIRKRLD